MSGESGFLTQKMITKGKNKMKDLAKRPARAITKNLSADQAKRIAQRISYPSMDPDVVLKNFGEMITRLNSEATTEGALLFSDPADKEKLRKAMLTYGLDTHLPLTESVGVSYWPMVMQNVREIEQEYDCKTPTEKMLAEMIAGSHAKIMEYTTYFTTITRVDYFTDHTNGYYAILSKEVDRAHRQMLNAVAMLKQIKSPPLNVSIHTKTAFVAENQQINATPPQP
jgi:hypothetical protein